MNIQKAINQMLVTGTVGAGLYANSTAGKLASERKSVNLGIISNLAQREAMQIPSEGEIPEEVSEPYKQNLQEGKDLASRAFELDPTKENYDKLLAEGKAGKDFEARLKKDLEERTETLRAQKEALEMRKKLLEATPEVPMQRKKVEVKSDGEE